MEAVLARHPAVREALVVGGPTRRGPAPRRGWSSARDVRPPRRAPGPLRRRAPAPTRSQAPSALPTTRPAPHRQAAPPRPHQTDRRRARPAAWTALAAAPGDSHCSGPAVPRGPHVRQHRPGPPSSLLLLAHAERPQDHPLSRGGRLLTVIHLVNIGKGDQFTPEFPAISPTTRCPPRRPCPRRRPSLMISSPRDPGLPCRRQDRAVPPRDVAPRAHHPPVAFWQMSGLGPVPQQSTTTAAVHAPRRIPYAMERFPERSAPTRSLDKQLSDRDLPVGDYTCRHGLLPPGRLRAAPGPARLPHDVAAALAVPPAASVPPQSTPPSSFTISPVVLQPG